MRFADAQALLVNGFVLRMPKLKRFVAANPRRVAATKAAHFADEILVIPLPDAVFGPKRLVKVDVLHLLQVKATMHPGSRLVVAVGRIRGPLLKLEYEQC